MTEQDKTAVRVLGYADSGICSGAESLFAAVLAGIAADPAFEVDFAAPSSNRELVALLEDATGKPPAADVPAQPLKLAALHLYDPRRRRAAAAALAGLEPDLVLLNLPSVEYGSTPLALRALQGTPIVGLVHITGSMEELDFRMGGTRARLARRVLRRLDRACVLSEGAARSFSEQWGSRDAHPAVIRMPRPEPVEVEQVAARRDLGLPTTGPLVGIGGRLTMKQKGHDTLIEASERIATLRPEVGFVVAGAGRDRVGLEKMVDDRGLSESWHFLGQVSPIDGFLGAIDAIAIPSRFEGLPLIALEALSAGVPGIASSVDGLSDIWPPGWLIEPDDSAALAAGLLAILEARPDEIAGPLESGRELMERRVADDPSADVRGVLSEVAADA